MNLRDFLSMYWGDNLITIYEHQADYEYNCFDSMTTSDIYDCPQFKDIADNDVVRFDIDKQGNITIYTVVHGYYLMEFEFDIDKLNKIDLEEELALEWLDEICTATNFNKIGKGKYELEDNADDLATIFMLMAKFKTQSWLLPNLKKWVSYSPDEGEINALKEIEE